MIKDPMPAERSSVDATVALPPRAYSFSPTRRTAVVLVGEGTTAAYLAGALQAIEEAGVRVDLVMGKGSGAAVAVMGAVQAGEKTRGVRGLISALEGKRPWRWRAPFAASAICLLVAFGVFVSPAIFGVLHLLAQSLLAVVSILAPTTVAALAARAESLAGGWISQIDLLYIRALAFPVALLFAFLMVGWIVPAAFRRRSLAGFGLERVFGEGWIQLSPVAGHLERLLWEMVRGTALEERPASPRDIGPRYRDLLVENWGQPGFREVIFYALDQDAGQEVPFALLKERWLGRLFTRGPAGGAIVAEPVNLAGEDAPSLFGALIAALTPAGLAASIPLRLPASGRHGGEVHRFSSSLTLGQGMVSDAMAAGAEQIIYISAAPSMPPDSTGSFERLSAAAVRQTLEADLRWVERERPALVFFLVRPDRQRLGLFEFKGRALTGGERLEVGALVAQGHRDANRLFIQHALGDARSERVPAPPEPTIQL
jgi:hypothetical protein